MRRPDLRLTSFRLPVLLVAVFGLLVGACATDGELGGPAVGGSLAASVGSFGYTSAELEDEVEAWAVNPNFMTQVLGITDIGDSGRRSSELVSFVLSHRVLTEQSRQLAEAGGYEPTQEEIDTLVAQIDQAFVDSSTGGPLFRVYDEAFRQRLGRDFAYQQNLQTVEATDLQAPEVEVNPRYGSFEDQDRGIGRVNPPAGPLPQPTPTGS